MAEHEVSPSDCAVAIAIPLTFEDLLHDITASNKDFARLLCRNASPEIVWNELYRPRLVEVVEGVSAKLSKWGSLVLRRATLADLSDLAQRYSVVAVCAHFKMTDVRAADLVDPARCLEIVRERASAVAEKLYHQAQQMVPDLMREPPLQRWELAGRLAPFLQTCVERTHAYVAAPPSVVRVSPPADLGAGLHRVHLEQCFGSAMRAASCVEMFDRLHTFPAFQSAIPADFSGVLDLSMCNSFMVAEDLKRSRPSSLVVENRFLAAPDVRLARYALVMRELARSRSRYTDALLRVHRAMAGA